MRGILFASLVTIVFLSTGAALGQQAVYPPDNSRGVQLPETDRGPNDPHASEPRVLKKGPLAPSEEDRTTYANFLARPQTGLIRLLPRQFSQTTTANGVVNITSADGDVKIRGGGAYYSFAFLRHEYGFGSDLELSTISRFFNGSRLPPRHEFSVGFSGADYGMMTSLGDVLLEQITSDDPAAHFLLAYRAPRAEPVARCEAMAFREGRLVDLQLYQSRLPIQLNNTYLLRSINYGKSDVVVAFRVVRQDPDGSVTIAWKLLKKFNPVELENVKYLNSMDKCP
jgi:hypothetical protein